MFWVNYIPDESSFFDELCIRQIKGLGESSWDESWFRINHVLDEFAFGQIRFFNESCFRLTIIWTNQVLDTSCFRQIKFRANTLLDESFVGRIRFRSNRVPDK